MMSKKAIITTSVLVVGAFLIYNEIQKQSQPRIFIRKRLSGNYNARTIPPFGIFVAEKHKDNAALIDHELIQWKQYQNKGLIRFYLDYFDELGRYGYDSMPMEIEARQNESDFCRTNYTYCVRNGLANTIFEPNFRT